MASTIFHHWLDQYRALPQRRRRWIHAGAWGLAAAATFALGFALGRGIGLPNGLESRARRLAAGNAALASQVQSLQQQQQTNTTALAALKETLASRDSEVQKLRQDQAFYAKLIGIDAGRSGLGVHSIALAPVPATDAWNFTATLVNTAENADPSRGTLTLDIEGVRAGKLVTLGWSSLAGTTAQDGVPFGFKFFQQVNGSFMLPRGFVPNLVTVTLHPKGAAPITRKLGWKEATGGQSDVGMATP